MEQAFWLIIAASVLMGYSINSAEAFKEEAGVIHVGGRVLCQDCTDGWNEWVRGAKPIKGNFSLSLSLSLSLSHTHTHIHTHTYYATLRTILASSLDKSNTQKKGRGKLCLVLLKYSSYFTLISYANFFNFVPNMLN